MLSRALLTGIKRTRIWKASKFFSSEKTLQQFGINFMHVEQMYLAHFPKTPCLGIWPSADRWPQSLGALHLWPPTAHPDTMNQKLKYSFRNQYHLETCIHNEMGEKLVFTAIYIFFAVLLQCYQMGTHKNKAKFSMTNFKIKTEDIE